MSDDSNAYEKALRQRPLDIDALIDGHLVASGESGSHLWQHAPTDAFMIAEDIPQSQLAYAVIDLLRHRIRDRIHAIGIG